jgi:tRNA modification GTPase
VATVGLAGPNAWEVLRAVFQRRDGRRLDSPPAPGRPILGRFGDDLADDVVLIAKHAGPADWFELHTHGGAQATRFALDLLASRGAVICAWPAFLKQLPGDRLQTLAAITLTEARTARTAGILLDQYHGAFAHCLDRVLEDLTNQRVNAARHALHELTAQVPLGRHLTTPWRVVLAGAPNVGKSTLINALAGFERAVVSPTPGTTRDLVATVTAIDGWPVELIDTAGQRSNADALEAQGIALARRAVATADLCLWIVDASGVPCWPAPEFAERTLVILNKCDLPPGFDRANGQGLSVSARTGQGLEELLASIAQRLVPSPPAPGSPVPFTAELCAGLARAAARLEAGDAVGTVALLRELRAGRLLEPADPPIHT